MSSDKLVTGSFDNCEGRSLLATCPLSVCCFLSSLVHMLAFSKYKLAKGSFGTFCGGV